MHHVEDESDFRVVDHFEEVKTFREQLKASGAGYVTAWHWSYGEEDLDSGSPRIYQMGCQMTVRLVNGARGLHVSYSPRENRRSYYVTGIREGDGFLSFNREQVLDRLKRRAGL